MISSQRCISFIVLLGIYLSQKHVLSVDIECVPLEQCPFATNILAKSHSKLAFELLNSTKCGIEEGTNKTKVWCNIIVRCITPDLKKGICIPASNCEELKNILGNTIGGKSQNIRSDYRCYMPGKLEDRVCCPLSNSTKSTLQRRKKRHSFNFPWNEHSDEQFFNHHGHHHHHHHNFHTQYVHNRHDFGENSDENNVNKYPFHSHNSNEDRSKWFHKILLNDSDNISGGNQYTDNSGLDWWNKKQIGNGDLEGNQYNITEESTSSPSEVCRIPENLEGSCKEIHHCSTILDALKIVNITDGLQVNYLKKFKCPSANPTDIKICCPESAIILPNSNNSTSITPKIHSSEEKNISLVPDSSSCGRQITNNKITGGAIADLTEYPWTALLQYRKLSEGLVFGCGGSIISRRYIVTAAHCVNRTILAKSGVEKLERIILGEFDTRNETDCIYTRYGTDCADPPQFFEVEQIIEHEQFDNTSGVHDIALIRVNRDIKFSNYIMPICLPDKNKFSLLGNESLFITGWGRTETGESSPVKRKARLPIVDKVNCNQVNSLNDGQICIGTGRGTDSCNGDSGGPVMLTAPVSGDLVTTLVGIISYGFGQCGTTPSVNAYVPFYLDWIMTHLS